LSHVAPKFERLLEAYRHEDGGKWSGIELERATGGVLSRSYVTNLRKGRIENPGMGKLAVIAKATGIALLMYIRSAIPYTIHKKERRSLLRCLQVVARGSAATARRIGAGGLRRPRLCPYPRVRPWPRPGA
jgi:transcriptional regulator with XRE-family HTH domain